jgi:AcrR family transcriptional regulator
MAGRATGRGRGTASTARGEGEGARSPTAKVRGERTRLRIAEAALALLEENEHPPTAKEIATRAGVSHRLLFHHFKDLESLLGVVASIQIERYRTEVAEVPSQLPLAARVDRTVRNRAALYESMGNLGSNVAALTGRVQTVSEGVARGHDLLLSRLEHTFRGELDAPGTNVRERLGAVDAAVSWHVWDYLQRVGRLSPSATRRVMRKLLQAALSD